VPTRRRRDRRQDRLRVRAVADDALRQQSVLVAPVDRNTEQVIELFKIVNARLQCPGVIDFVGRAENVIDLGYGTIDHLFKLKLPSKVVLFNGQLLETKQHALPVRPS